MSKKSCPFLYSQPLYQNGQDFLVIQWFHTCFHSVGLQNNVHCTRRSMVWTASALLSVYTLILDFWLEGAEYIERRNMNTASYCLLHDISSFLSTHFVIALCLHIFFYISGRREDTIMFRCTERCRVQVYCSGI